MIMRNRKRYLLIGIIAFTVLAASISAYVIMPRGTAVQLSPLELGIFFEVIKDGDIICRLGDRVWSQHFRDVSVTDRRFSHMGIIRVIDDRVTVIHAEGNTGHGTDFVEEVPLEDFIEFARAIGVYRVRNVDGSQISNIALEYLGVPFDWRFDMSCGLKLYCTELLYVILKRLAPEINLKTIHFNLLGREIIPLEAISNSEHFYEVFFVGSN